MSREDLNLEFRPAALARSGMEGDPSPKQMTSKPL